MSIALLLLRHDLAHWAQFGRVRPLSWFLAICTVIAATVQCSPNGQRMSCIMAVKVMLLQAGTSAATSHDLYTLLQGHVMLQEQYLVIIV